MARIGARIARNRGRAVSDKLFILNDLVTICPKAICNPAERGLAPIRGHLRFIHFQMGGPGQQQRLLLSEEIFESLASIQRPGGGSLPFDGGSRRVKVALVARILLGDAGTDRLGAFKAAGGIKIQALLAAMQLRPAARALRGEVDPCRQQGRA